MVRHCITDRIKVSIFNTGFGSVGSKFIFVRPGYISFEECSEILRYSGVPRLRYDDILVLNCGVLDQLPLDLTVLYLGKAASARNTARMLRQDNLVLQDTFVIPIDDFGVDAMNLLEGCYKESEVFVEEDEVTVTRYKLDTKPIEPKPVVEDSIVKESLVSRLLNRW